MPPQGARPPMPGYEVMRRHASEQTPWPGASFQALACGSVMQQACIPILAQPSSFKLMVARRKE
eukprot:4663420-Amphidinium_carterae.1